MVGSQEAAVAYGRRWTAKAQRRCSARLLDVGRSHRTAIQSLLTPRAVGLLAAKKYVAPAASPAL